MAYWSAFQIYDRLGRRGGMADTLLNLGAFYGKQDKLDPASQALRESLALNEDLDRRDGMAIGNFNLAVLKMRQGQADLARDHAVNARRLYTEMGMELRVADADELLAEIDQAPANRDA